ncbi:MAG: KTSC domain-containing protein [Rhizobiales bacterium]|nr:KTSC domain-containing protein [Hyphomicrobiales bacterium]
MQRYTIASSNIASIGYDDKTETLEVEFLNGSIYQYYNVPTNMYDNLMREGSKGRFLNTYIKNAYPYSRIG